MISWCRAPESEIVGVQPSNLFWRALQMILMLSNTWDPLWHQLVKQLKKNSVTITNCHHRITQSFTYLMKCFKNTCKKTQSTKNQQTKTPKPKKQQLRKLDSAMLSLFSVHTFCCSFSPTFWNLWILHLNWVFYFLNSETPYRQWQLLLLLQLGMIIAHFSF